MFQSVCDIMVNSGLFRMAWFDRLDENAREPRELIAHSGDCEGVLQQFRRGFKESETDDPVKVAIRGSEVCWIKDIRAHPVPEPIRLAALQRGILSVISVPVSEDGQPYGVLTLCYEERDLFWEGTVKFLKERLARMQAVFRTRSEAPGPRPEAHEAELKGLLNVIPQTLGLISADGRLLHVNRFAVEYYGHPLEDLVSGAATAKIAHPDDLEMTVLAYSNAFPKGVAFEYESRMRRNDGQLRWNWFRVTPLRDDEGHIIRWCSIGVDIEDRKQAEERLRKENIALREVIGRASLCDEIVGSSKALRRVQVQVAKAAPSDTTVLILGETGTGKELTARAVHRRSKRAERAFIPVNCAAIPQSLIASELFGHEKGAFTGALEKRIGRFESADGGTIFLDEIGELPAETQAILLRVLQEREFERVGGTKSIRVDVRVVAATNRDLSAAVAAGNFRQDLYYRLNVFPIQVPALRERADDIPVLLEYFIDLFAKKAGKKILSVSKNTLKLFQTYDWPGNIRELQNIVERAVLLCEDDTFSVDATWFKRESPSPSALAVPRLAALVDQEKGIIESALAESRGRISGPMGAAAKLGIPRTTLEAKIASLGINKYRFKT